MRRCSPRCCARSILPSRWRPAPPRSPCTAPMWSPPNPTCCSRRAGAVTIVALFPAFGLYGPQRGASLADELRNLLLAWLVIAALAAGALFATKSGEAFSRVWVAAWLAGGFAATTVMRIVLRVGLRALRRRGRNLRHIAIVGAGALGARVAAHLADAAWAGFSVAAFYDDDATKHGTRVAGRMVAGRPERLAADIATGTIDQVWIALPLRAESRVREILTLLREHAVEIRFVPDIFGFHLLNHSLTEVAGLPVLSLTATPMTGSARLVKALEDYALGAARLRVGAADDGADRTRHQAHLARPGAVPAGARHVERRAFRDAQVPHDAGGCRTRERAGLVAPGRSARDPLRRAAAPVVAGRVAATRQRPARRHVARGTASRTARSSSSSSGAKSPATCRSTW